MSAEDLTIELEDDRRNPTIGGDNRRALYDRMRDIHRESPINELDQDGAQRLALEYADALEKMNPYVALRYQLEHGGWDLSSPHFRVGAFKLIYPTLKSLNDTFLGKAAADVYLERLSELIYSHFGTQDGCVVFAMKGKSGHFLFDLQKYAQSRGMTMDAALRNFAHTLKFIQEEATSILRDILGAKFAELIGRLKGVDEDLEVVRSRSTMPLKDLLDSNDEGDRLKDRLKRTAALTNSLPEAPTPRLSAVAEDAEDTARTAREIDTLSGELGDLGDDLVSADGAALDPDESGYVVLPVVIDGHCVHIGFGLAHPSETGGEVPADDPVWNRTLLNSDRAARTTGLRTFQRPQSETGNPDATLETDRSYERLLFQIHNYVHTIMDLLRARLEFERALGEMQWTRYSDFFHRVGGRLQMRQDMIIQYRKEAASGVYTGVLAQDPEMREIFANYYDWVNTLDGFNDPDYERAGDIVSLVHELRATEDLEGLKPLLAQAREQMSVSMKDVGNKVTRTVRAEVGVVLSGQHTATIIGDHVGFGGMNQASYEESMFDLFDVLGIDLGELAAIGDKALERGHLLSLASRCFDGILRDSGARERFFGVIDSIGQRGTQHIRDAEVKLVEYARSVGAKDVVVVPGGDEVRVVMTGDIDAAQVRKGLYDVAQDLRMRLFAMVRDISDDEDDEELDVDETLAQHMSVMATAEDCFERKKDQGAQGATAHILVLDSAADDEDYIVQSIRGSLVALS